MMTLKPAALPTRNSTHVIGIGVDVCQRDMAALRKWTLILSLGAIGFASATLEVLDGGLDQKQSEGHRNVSWC